MKRTTFILAAAMLILGSTARAAVTDYSFTASSGTFTALTGATVPELSSGSYDDGYYNGLPIGFTFRYDGVDDSTFSAGTNGWMTLGQDIDNSEYNNSLSDYGDRPVIAPLWDDLDMTSGTFSYKTEGVTPNQIFTAEWLNAKWDLSATGPVISFQVKLYEADNHIEFIYQQADSAVNAGSASIGLTASAAGSGNFLSLDGTGSNPGVSSTVETSDLSIKPANGQVYSFALNTMAYVSSTSTQTNTNVVMQGSTDQQIIGIEVVTSGSLSPLSVTRFSLNTTGTTSAADITGAKIYYTGTSSTFAATGLFGSQASPSGDFKITGTQELAGGTNYFWLVYDIAAGATVNNVVDAGCDSILVAGTLRTPSVTAPAGSRQIKAPMSGTYTVGPTGNYASLTAALSDLNILGLGGAVLLELQGTYTSTGETFPIAFNSISGSSSSNTVTVRPATGATALSISSSATQTVNLNGAGYIIFDGRAGGAGGIQLTIANTSTTGNAIQFINDASNNIIRYCEVTGVTTSTSNGVVRFSTSTGSTGNDNNTITYCNLHDGATTPTNIIYASGTNGKDNDGNVISNNSIYNFFISTNVGIGIYITGYNSDWTISGNSIYQTASRAFTAASSGFIGISLANTFGNNFTMNNNYIGGSASSCGGSAWTQTGAFTHTFIGIRLSIGSTTPSNVQGNVIKNISIATSTTSSINAAISLTTGSVNIGTTTGNIIGDQTATGSITFTGAGSGAHFNGILTGTGTPYVINISNNKIGGITVAGAGTTYLQGIYIQGAATSYNVSGNIIGSTSTANSLSNSTNQITYGIRSSSSSTSNTIANDTIANISASGTSTANQLIGIATTAGVNIITGNVVYNLSSASTRTTAGSGAVIIGISQSSATDGQTISRNVIHSLPNSAAAAAVNLTGLYYAGPATGTNLISRNFIHSLSMSTTSATALINGIHANGGTSTFQNNMVRLGIDAAGAALTNGIAVNGINDAAGTNNYYFNSVYVGGSGVNTTAGSTYAFNSAVITNVRNFQDNIFVNARSNATTGGKHYGVKVGGTAPNPTGLTINYNVYNVTGTGGVFGYFNSADVADLSAWKTAVGQDANSASGDPAYLTPAGSAATVDLHINASTITPVEGAGLAIGGITDDYDGQVRSTLTPVDIGADAGDFTPVDLAPPSISYTALSTTSDLTSPRTFGSVTVTDASGVNTTAGTRPRCYYKKIGNDNTYTGNTSADSGWKYVEAEGSGGSPFTFLINYTLLYSTGTVAAGDTIQYLVVAQDLATTPNVGINSGTFAAAPASVALTVAAFPIGGTIRNYAIIGAPMSGDYTVGSGGNYTTLTAAVADLNIRGVGGATRFLLTDAAYPSETFPIVISSVAGVSAVNTITIKPASGADPALSGALASGAVIKIYNTNYVTIDGSAVGSSDRDLTIANTSTTSPSVIWIGSSGTTPVAYTTIKNCNISNGAATSTAVVIGDGSVIGNAGYFDHTTVENNSITKADKGVYANGGTTPQKGSNLQLIDNLMTAAGADAIGYCGLHLDGVNRAEIRGNELANFDTTTGQDDKGIWIGYGVINTSCSRNRIYNLSGPSDYGAHGIYVATTASGASDTLANNLIYNITGAGWGYTESNWKDNPYAIVLDGSQSGIGIYHNSINLYGNTLIPYGAISAGIVLGDGSQADIRSNIIVNNLGRPAVVDTCYGSVGIHARTDATQFTAIDHNIYYCNATGGGVNEIGHIGSDPGTGYATLGGWQSATGMDGNSINADPLYISNTDLQISTGSGYDPAPPGSHGGTAITGVNIDFAGSARDGSNPDIGAYEFELDRTLTANGSLPACGGYDDVTVNGSGITAALAGNAGIYGTLSLSSGNLSIGANTLTLNGAISQTGGTLAGGGSSSITVGGSGAGDTIPAVSGGLNNLTITRGNGVTLGGSLSLGGALALTSGILTTGSNTITLGPSAAITEGASSYVVGNVQATRILSKDVNETFGGLGLEINAAGAAPGATTVIRRTGTTYTQGVDTVSIKRNFDISPATNTGLNATMVFHYLEAELNGIAEANLALFRSLDAGIRWGIYGSGGTVNVGANTVTGVNIDGFSLWTLGDKTNPLPVQLSSFSILTAGDAITLSWRTESENNTYVWIIQRSDKSDAGYIDVGRMAAQGTSCVPHNYVWSELCPAPEIEQFYRLMEVDLDSTITLFGPVSSKASRSMPLFSGLKSIGPNPFSATATINYQVATRANVKAAVYNVAGQLIKIVADQIDNPGYHSVTWNGKDANDRRAAAGVYICRLEIAGRQYLRRITMLR